MTQPSLDKAGSAHERDGDNPPLRPSALAPARTNAGGSGHSPTRAAAASAVGAIVDWYDYFLYGTASALVFSDVFFPTSDPSTGQLASFATFAIGFFFRPIGSIFFGHFGDRIGRKRMLVLTMLLMGTASACIGLVPTHAQIGLAAPVLLVALRAVQGFAVGGEWGGAALMAVESAPRGKRALFGSVVQSGAYVGQLVAYGAFYLTRTLVDNHAFMQWGWRIPFLISAVIIAIGYFIRRGVSDTPEFLEAKVAGQIEKIPLWSALRQNPRSFLIIFGMRIGENVANYMVLTFALAYATDHLDVESSTMLVALMVTSAASLFSVPLIARIADRFGYYPVYVFGAAAGIALAFPFMAGLRTGNTVVIIASTLVTLTLVEIAMAAVQQPIFTELFDPQFRYSGAGFAYQVTAALGGGLTPLIATELVNIAHGATYLAATYMALFCAVSLGTTVAVRDRIRATHDRREPV